MLTLRFRILRHLPDVSGIGQPFLMTSRSRRSLRYTSNICPLSAELTTRRRIPVKHAQYFTA